MRMPKRDEPRRVSPIVLAALGASALLAAILFGPAILRSLSGKDRREANEEKEKIFNSIAANAPFSSADWHSEKYDGISFDSPISPKPDPELKKRFIAGRNVMADAGEVLMGSDDARDFHLMVMRVVCNPGTEPNLDGAGEGGVKGAARSWNDSDPKFTSDHTFVGGLPARRMSYSMQGNTGLFLEGICVQDGLVVWQIVVTSSRKNLKADARRIFDSLKYDASQKPTTNP